MGKEKVKWGRGRWGVGKQGKDSSYLPSPSSKALH